MAIRSAVLATTLIAFVTGASAGTMEIGWDSVSGASGYRVYLGTEPGEYDASIDVGPVTETALTDLEDCTTYFVAVKAYNQSGSSPSYSNEVTGWARPELASETLTATQGGQLVLEIDGANFEAGAVVSLGETSIPEDPYGNPLIRFGQVSVLSCHRAEVLMTVEPTTAGLQAMNVGPLDLPLEVTNPDGVFRSGSLPLEILFDKSRADVNRSNERTADRVDGDDLATLARGWASAFGDPDFQFEIDLDGDADVDGDDLALLAVVFGRCRSGSEWTAAACADENGT